MVKGLDKIPDARLRKAIQHGLHLPPADHAAAGDHQHIVDTLFPEKGTQLPDPARTFQILGHPVAHAVVAHLQHCLKDPAAHHFQFVRYRHRGSLLADPSLRSGGVQCVSLYHFRDFSATTKAPPAGGAHCVPPRVLLQ